MQDSSETRPNHTFGRVIFGLAGMVVRSIVPPGREGVMKTHIETLNSQATVEQKVTAARGVLGLVPEVRTIGGGASPEYLRAMYANNITINEKQPRGEVLALEGVDTVAEFAAGIKTPTADFSVEDATKMVLEAFALRRQITEDARGRSRTPVAGQYTPRY